MSRIITRMTRGRIAIGTTKKVLVLAVAGALYFGEVTIPPVIPPTPNINYNTSFGGSGGFTNHIKKSTNKDFEDKYKKSLEDLEKIILEEDKEILLIIKAFLYHVNN